MINPARVDFVTLRLFCSVVRTGSITKGAAHCHLALSAASRRLSDFEAATGEKLLERSASGVKVTPAGHIAAQHAIRLFQGFELFGNELADHAKGYSGQVRLWANMSALTEFLPDSLAAFMEAQPGIRVDIEEQLSSDIVLALVDGLADIGVFAEGTPSEGLTLHDYRKDELVLLCSRSHEIASRRRTAFADCLSYDFVGLNRGSSLLELTSRAAAETGRMLRLRVQVRSFDAMCQMIASNLGVGVLPRAACEAVLTTRKLKAIPLTDDWAARRLMLGYSNTKSLSKAAIAMVNHLLMQQTTSTNNTA